MPEDAIAATLSSTGITNFWIHLYENNDVQGGITSKVADKKITDSSPEEVTGLITGALQTA